MRRQKKTEKSRIATQVTTSTKSYGERGEIIVTKKEREAEGEKAKKNCEIKKEERMK